MGKRGHERVPFPVVGGLWPMERLSGVTLLATVHKALSPHFFLSAYFHSSPPPREKATSQFRGLLTARS